MLVSLNLECENQMNLEHRQTATLNNTHTRVHATYPMDKIVKEKGKHTFGRVTVLKSLPGFTVNLESCRFKS